MRTGEGFRGELEGIERFCRTSSSLLSLSDGVGDTGRPGLDIAGVRGGVLGASVVLHERIWDLESVEDSVESRERSFGGRRE